MFGECYQDNLQQQQLLHACWTLSEQESQSIVHFFPVFQLHLLNTKDTTPVPSLHKQIAPHNLTPSSSASQETQQIPVLMVGSCSKWMRLRQQTYTGTICNLISRLLLRHTKPNKNKVLLLHIKCC